MRTRREVRGYAAAAAAVAIIVAAAGGLSAVSAAGDACGGVVSLVSKMVLRQNGRSLETPAIDLDGIGCPPGSEQVSGDFLRGATHLQVYVESEQRPEWGTLAYAGREVVLRTFEPASRSEPMGPERSAWRTGWLPFDPEAAMASDSAEAYVCWNRSGVQHCLQQTLLAGP